MTELQEKEITITYNNGNIEKITLVAEDIFNGFQEKLSSNPNWFVLGGHKFINLKYVLSIEIEE